MGSYIIEYGSTLYQELMSGEAAKLISSCLYVGMAQKKNGDPIKRVQNLMFRTLLWM